MHDTQKKYYILYNTICGIAEAKQVFCNNFLNVSKKINNNVGNNY